MLFSDLYLILCFLCYLKLLSCIIEHHRNQDDIVAKSPGIYAANVVSYLYAIEGPHNSASISSLSGPRTCAAAVKLCCENLVAEVKCKALDQKYKEKYPSVFGAPASSKLRPEVTHYIKLKEPDMVFFCKGYSTPNLA